MNNTSNTQYGNWKSAISAELIVSDSISLDEPRIRNNVIYYIERRPKEQGRCVIVKVTDNTSEELLPAPYSARSRVHEYGGGCYTVSDEQVFFVNDSDQQIYQIANHQITQLTFTAQSRYADIIHDKQLNQLIAVCESHTSDSVINSLVSISLTDGNVTTLTEGADFYASPRLESATRQLCWQCWDQPNMPWDGNELWLANIDPSGALANKRMIAGGENISVFQPLWSPQGTLHYVADNDGWWHLYQWHDNNDGDASAIQLTQGECEFGQPQWVFGQTSYAFLNSQEIICCFQQAGQSKLALLALDSQVLKEVYTPYNQTLAITAENNHIAMIAASGTHFPELLKAKINTSTELSLVLDPIKSSCKLPIAEKYYSTAQTLRFENRHGQPVFANYYPPLNPDIAEVENQHNAPPMIVICHGGPTGQSGTALDPRKQFWTSRGFALLDVNYSGSTGFGRQYRERLNKLWGVLDVEDCCDAANYAVAKKLANPEHLIIRGSSAGGYTVLAALTFHDVFSAGASYYGISELSSLASDTHKFEARYLDKLIGPYPENDDIYKERSPIEHTESLNCPVIFFQGIEDKVVPKEQAEKMFDALDRKKMTVAAQYYAGEQHGFRQAETIVNTLENELAFYQLVFKLKAPEDIKFRGDIMLQNAEACQK